MRKVWILIAVVGLAFGVMLLLARSQHSEWTTDSSAALAALIEGHEARMKIYEDEAAEHYRRALELDPDFIAANLALMVVSKNKKEREGLAAELAAADLSELTAREQFLVRYRLAREEGRTKEAKQILKAFLEAYPEDPWGLDAYADWFWRDGELVRAQEIYERLLAADPNWVLAQNRLGYLAMAQGRFEDAEELFRTYKYIAPDQANPHDSMGELLTVLGRYDEAREEIGRALEIKPDFCGSYPHLLEVEILRGRPDAADEVLDRAAEAGCGGHWVEDARCENRFWSDYLSGDYESPWREESAECFEKVGEEFFLVHRMAALTGRFDYALEMEERFAEHLRKMGHGETAYSRRLKGIALHLEGVRLMAQGDFGQAAAVMKKADALIEYWGQDEAILKLWNRLNLAAAHDLGGERKAAKLILADVAAVHPPFADFYGYLIESFS